MRGEVQYDAVIKKYCREAVDESCVRLVYRDYNEANCQLIREEIYDVIEVLVTE